MYGSKETALHVSCLRAIGGDKHTVSRTLQCLANDCKHNGVIFYDEDGFKCILFRLSHRFHLAQVKVVFSDSDGGYPPELKVSLLGGYEF